MADELISRQAAIKLLRGECVAKYPSSFSSGLCAAANELSKLPAANAVEVVRCGECIHRGEDSWCAYVDDDPDFFCKRGERRGENAKET